MNKKQRPNPRPRDLLVVSALLYITNIEVAHAYIDPGSAGLIMTAILGAIGSIAFAFRSWIAKAKGLFVKKAPDQEGDRENEPEDDRK